MIKNSKPKIIVVCGPTSTGKSDYAVILAKKIGGEIISADSRQVYRGLDIGSGKITEEEMKGIHHHLLDVASPKRTFSVARYKELGQKVIAGILKRDHTPIICGGSGLYIDSLVYDTSFPQVSPNRKLRHQLSHNSAAENFQYLKKLDPQRAQSIDPHNNVRLIRAIEIAKALGEVPNLKKKLKYQVEWIYLDFPDKVLKQRIHDRLLKRLAQGMIEEVANLHVSGISWKRLEALGLEYRYLSLYLQDKVNYNEMVEQLEKAIWQYVRRQRTWFKKYAK